VPHWSQRFSRVASELGSISILVNNAGKVSLSAGILHEKPEDWDNVIETQLNAVFLLSKLAAQSMMNHQGGKIINIGASIPLLPMFLTR